MTQDPQVQCRTHHRTYKESKMMSAPTTPSLAEGESGNQKLADPDVFDPDKLNPLMVRGPGKVGLKPREITTESRAKRFRVLREALGAFDVKFYLAKMEWEDDQLDGHPVVAHDEDGERWILIDYRYSSKISSETGYRLSQRQSNDWSRYDVRFALEMADALAEGLTYLRSVWPEGAKTRQEAKYAIHKKLHHTITAHV
jgi:hypothetical protein